MRAFLWACQIALALIALGACGHATEGGLLFYTADPNLAIKLTIPTPPGGLPEATATATVMAEEEVGEVLPDPTPLPPCEIIKGNISASGEKIYHMPGQANYNRVKIDEAAGEAFFCNEAQAQAAGFRKALR